MPAKNDLERHSIHCGIEEVGSTLRSCQLFSLGIAVIGLLNRCVLFLCKPRKAFDKCVSLPGRTAKAQSFNCLGAGCKRFEEIPGTLDFSSSLIKDGLRRSPNWKLCGTDQSSFGKTHSIISQLFRRPHRSAAVLGGQSTLIRADCVARFFCRGKCVGESLEHSAIVPPELSKTRFKSPYLDGLLT